jgi:recombination protein RecA
MSIRTDDYDEIVAKINKKYGDSIRRGGDYEIVPRISTGSLELDLAMGGGVPVGRWTRFYGGYASGKTLRALTTARVAQEMGLTVAYYNVEKQFDTEFSEKSIGLDVNELTIVEGATIEEIGDKMEALMTVCHVHIIDSCSMAVSEDELNADIRDWRPGISARAWGKVFKRLNERFDHFANTTILIDQMRTNFKTGGDQAAGGKVFDFQSSMSVVFKKSGWIARDKDGILDDKAVQGKGMDGQMEPAGIEIKCRVEKSRVCRPFRTATLRWDLDEKHFDDMFEYMKAATYYGPIDQRGAYYYHPQADGTEIKIGQGKKSLRSYIEGNEELQEEIRTTAFARQG